jgi:multiple sugar transport system permease protein
MKRIAKKKIGLAIRYGAAVLVIFIAVMPIIWLFLTSIKNQKDSFAMPPVWNFTPVFTNYKALFTDGTFLKYLWNSFYIASMATLVACLIGTPMAYMLSRYDFKGKKFVSFWVLSSRIAPPLAIVMPFFLMFRFLGILNSYTSVIIIYMTLNIAFFVWMMKGYFGQIPKSIEESARIDGCSIIKAMLLIAVPLVAQGLASTLVFTFIANWSEFVLALIFTGLKTRTLPVLIAGYVTTEGVLWGMIGAVGTLVNLPIIIFSLTLQKYLVTGMTAGAVK